MKRKPVVSSNFYVANNDVPYTLIIIDVQYGYSAAEEGPHLDHIIKQINEAKRNNAAILIVNYKGIGKSIGCVWDAAHDHVYYDDILKSDNNGSDEIIRAFKRNKYMNRTNIKIGGVYTELCLTETVNGLSKKLTKSNIEVLTKCCNGNEESILYFCPSMYENDGTYNPFGAIEPRDNVQLIF